MSQTDENNSSPTATPSAGWQTAALPYAGPPETANYPPPGYPAPGYPAPGYPAPGYPAPGYPPYGYPYGYPPQRGPGRPGAATASAVLMFIQAAVVLISTFYVLFFASLAGGASASGISEADSLETEWTVIGILQLVSVGLLIFAGVQLLGGASRTLTIVACGVQLGFVLYWMIRISSLPDFDVDGDTFLFVIPLMYAVLPLVSLPLALGKAIGDYLSAKKGAASVAP